MNEEICWREFISLKYTYESLICFFFFAFYQILYIGELQVRLVTVTFEMSFSFSRFLILSVTLARGSSRFGTDIRSFAKIDSHGCRATRYVLFLFQ